MEFVFFPGGSFGGISRRRRSRLVFKGLEVTEHQMVKIPVSSDPPDPPDMKPLDVDPFVVLIQGFHFWQLFGFFWPFLFILKCTHPITPHKKS